MGAYFSGWSFIQGWSLISNLVFLELMFEGAYSRCNILDKYEHLLLITFITSTHLSCVSGCNNRESAVFSVLIVQKLSAVPPKWKLDNRGLKTLDDNALLEHRPEEIGKSGK